MIIGNHTIMRYAVAILVCLGAGFLGSIFTTTAIDGWYATLNRPSFSPPNWLFGPVWTALYIMMGIAAGIIWTRARELPKRQVNIALTAFAFQLLLNIAWSILFFGLHSPLLALIDIIILLIAISITAYRFMQISIAAGWLLVPYLLWVSFASILNYALWRLNP